MKERNKGKTIEVSHMTGCERHDGLIDIEASVRAHYVNAQGLIKNLIIIVMHRVRSEFNSVLSLEKVDWWNPIRTSAIQSISCPMQFLGFCNHEKGAPRQEIFT
jgi:hypothetical protein